MYATDYPHWDFDAPSRRCARCRPSGATRSASETAAELFGVPVPAAA